HPAADRRAPRAAGLDRVGALPRRDGSAPRRARAEEPGDPRRGREHVSPRAHPRAALALAGAIAALAAAAPPLRAQVDAGREALRAGRYDEAVDRYGEALRTDAGNVGARAGLIEALLATGRYDEAIRAGHEAPE